MILHELATNSAKHGALSGEGRVVLSWQIDEEGPVRVQLSWIECDGPPVGEPRRAGFGMSLIQRSVTHLLAGELDYRLEPGGLECMIGFPIER